MVIIPSISLLKYNKLKVYYKLYIILIVHFTLHYITLRYITLHFILQIMTANYGVRHMPSSLFFVGMTIRQNIIGY